ncbi:MAG TPA: ATP-binding protein, partial [Ktedonobacterales bacterium]
RAHWATSTTPLGRCLGAPKTPRARIVLADDNADMRDYLRRLLSERYTVEAVANGAQALAAIQRQLPDLVLGDVMMPELDGFGMLRALRTDPATVTLPVMLLSARAGEEATIEGLAAGADDYLVKPFSAREVLSRVAARLEITHARQEAERRLHQSLTALMNMAEALVRDVGGVVAASHDRSQIPAGAPETTDVQQVADSSAKPDPLEAARSTIRQLLGLMQRVLDGQRAGASYIDSETGAFDVLALAGLSPEVEQYTLYTLSNRRLSDYYPTQVLDRLNAEEIVVLNFAVQPPASGQDFHGLTNLIIVPARIDAQRLLVVAVEARDRPAFTWQERDLAQAVARLVRLVVERERLVRECEDGLMRELALTESKRRMDEFLGVASHELRTPIATIMANVQLTGRQLRGLSQQAAALESPDGTNGLTSRLERAELLIERTERQMARLNRLIGDLLDVSRIHAGKLEMRLEPCDLLEIVRDAVREQCVAWPERSIELDLPQRADLEVTVDPDRISQVVTNLLTNALKYSRTEQPVTVRVRQHGEVARVEVRDHGPGLTVEQQAHLFERYYRVPGIKQQSGSGIGLGLGLHICKTIIERHCGVMGVVSQPGEGSTFWFTLPLAGVLHPGDPSYYRPE